MIRMKRFLMSVSEEMYEELEKEMKSRNLYSIQELVRQIIAQYLRNRNTRS